MPGKPVELTKDEWVEIYAALETKALRIEQGEYDPEGTLRSNARWVADLRAIAEKIGPDGCHAAARGVLASGGGG